MVPFPQGMPSYGSTLPRILPSGPSTPFSTVNSHKWKESLKYFNTVYYPDCVAAPKYFPGLCQCREPEWHQSGQRPTGVAGPAAGGRLAPSFNGTVGKTGKGSDRGSGCRDKPSTRPQVTPVSSVSRPPLLPTPNGLLHLRTVQAQLKGKPPLSTRVQSLDCATEDRREELAFLQSLENVHVFCLQPHIPMADCLKYFLDHRQWVGAQYSLEWHRTEAPASWPVFGWLLRS